MTRPAAAWSPSSRAAVAPSIDGAATSVSDATSSCRAARRSWNPLRSSSTAGPLPGRAHRRPLVREPLALVLPAGAVLLARAVLRGPDEHNPQAPGKASLEQ